MSDSQKSISKNTARGVFIAIIVLFIFRYIKGLWQFSFDLEMFDFYNFLFLAYVLIIGTVFFNSLSLWAIFKNKLWWFKTFFIALFLQLVDSLFSLFLLMKNPNVLISIFMQSPRGDLEVAEFMAQFLTQNYLYLYVFLTFIFFVILFVITYKKRKVVVYK